MSYYIIILSFCLIYFTGRLVKNMLLFDVQQDFHDKKDEPLSECHSFRMKYKNKIFPAKFRLYSKFRNLFTPKATIFVSYQTNDKEYAINLAKSIEQDWTPYFFLMKPSLFGPSYSWQSFILKCNLIDSDSEVHQTTSIYEKIINAMRESDLVLTICGEKTSQSNWVASETTLAHSFEKPLVVLSMGKATALPQNLSEGYPVYNASNSNSKLEIFKAIEEILFYKEKRNFVFIQILSISILGSMLAMEIYKYSVNSVTFFVVNLVFAASLFLLTKKSGYIWKWSNGYRFKRFRTKTISDVEDVQGVESSEDDKHTIQYFRMIRWVIPIAWSTLGIGLILSITNSAELFYYLMYAVMFTVIWIFYKLQLISRNEIKRK